MPSKMPIVSAFNGHITPKTFTNVAIRRFKERLAKLAANGGKLPSDIKS